MDRELPLFRAAAVDAKRTSALGSIVLAQPLSFGVGTTAAFAVAAVIAGFFVWGTYTKHMTLGGRLVPNLGVIDVHAPQTGTVIEKHVAEGDRVAQGEALFVISSERSSRALGATRELVGAELERRLALLEEQVRKLRELERTERASLEGMIATLESELEDLAAIEESQSARVELAVQVAARYERLRGEGFVSEEQLIARREALLEQQSRLTQLERERTSIERRLAELGSELLALPLEYGNRIAELEQAIAATRQELADNEVARLVTVTAPAPGIATAVRVEVGQSVASSGTLVSIVPEGSRLEAKLYAPSRAVGFIDVGDDVRLRYDAYPYQKFGHQPGKVTSVSRTALVASGGPSASSAEPLYEITVELESQTMTAYGEPRPLLPGMTVEADVLLESRRLYEWALEPLYTLTSKVR
ncbi:MAG: HlyD family efflux transporter periplasmic adaptor subunit [Gammaproteobacteria bacterium]